MNDFFIIFTKSIFLTKLSFEKFDKFRLEEDFM